jgi:hypothetical protein
MQKWPEGCPGRRVSWLAKEDAKQAHEGLTLALLESCRVSRCPAGVKEVVRNMNRGRADIERLPKNQGAKKYRHTSKGTVSLY